MDLEKNTVSLSLFRRVLKEIKNTDQASRIMDSFSSDQFASKERLLSLLDKFQIINEKSVVTVFGCWYGSILVPVLSPRVKQMILIDVDEVAVRFGKHRFFEDLPNLTWIYGDVFECFRDEYLTSNVFVNTSCEHMKPMNQWPYWHRVQKHSHFAFQSNNMFQIKDHVNCVKSLEDFKTQLPDNFQVMCEDELEDQRGIRFTLIGKIL